MFSKRYVSYALDGINQKAPATAGAFSLCHLSWQGKWGEQDTSAVDKESWFGHTTGVCTCVPQGSPPCHPERSTQCGVEVLGRYAPKPRNEVTKGSPTLSTPDRRSRRLRLSPYGFDFGLCPSLRMTAWVRANGNSGRAMLAPTVWGKDTRYEIR